MTTGSTVERPLLFLSDQIEVAASAAQVWDLIKTFGRIDAWHPATENCNLLVGANGVPFAVREFGLRGGGFVISELLEYREDVRWYRYRILKTNLPLHSYEGEMHVAALPGKGCVVKWTSQFQCPEGPGHTDEQTTQLVQGVFRSGLEHIVTLFESR